MHRYRRILLVSSQNLLNAFALTWKKKFIIVQKCDPTGFVLMIADTVLVSFWKSRLVGPFIKGDASFLPIRLQRFDVIIGTIIIVEVKVLKSDDLMKLNPLWQESRGIFEFQTGR